MSITPVGSNTCTNSAYSQNSFKKLQADFKALSTALQNNDLASAQQAFAQIQKDDPKLAQAMPAQQNSSSGNSANSASNDLASLASALQNGDLSGAQKALAAFQQDAQAVRGHHHRHHGGSPPATEVQTPAVSSDGDNDGSTGSSASTVGGIINTSA